MAGLTGPLLVTATWLAAHLGQPGLVVLDASLRNHSKGESQIPGSQTFDIDGNFSDKSSPLPHTLPSAEAFAREVRALGINRDDFIVVYDRAGIYSSPRARWMFRAMGHDAVAVLDGGFPAWERAGLPVEPRKDVTRPLGNFEARFRPQMVRNAEQVSRALNDPQQVVLDARSAGRFRGVEPEPRAGLRPGHMPNARNLPFTEVLSQGHLKPVDELKPLFLSLAESRLIFSCGSGVTACIIALAAEAAGCSDLAVYDGSWSEWGLPAEGGEERPVVSEGGR